MIDFIFWRRAVVTGTMLLALPQARAQLTLIEENFNEATPGGRLTAGAEGTGQVEIRPSEGRFSVHALDEGEIVEAWDGNAFQFQDKVENAALRLIFEAPRDVDPITSGTLEVSLEFRINAQESTPYGGNILQVALTAPTQGCFLMATIHGRNGRIYHTNRNTPPAYESMVEGDIMHPDTIYQLKLIVSLDQSTYDIKVTEKEGGNTVWSASAQQFIPIPDLENNGVGTNLLDIQAGSPDFSQNMEPPVTVTVDNIFVRYLK